MPRLQVFSPIFPGGALQDRGGGCEMRETVKGMLECRRKAMLRKLDAFFVFLNSYVTRDALAETKEAVRAKGIIRFWSHR